jgi:hypothetical protein
MSRGGRRRRDFGLAPYSLAPVAVQSFVVPIAVLLTSMIAGCGSEHTPLPEATGAAAAASGEGGSTTATTGAGADTGATGGSRSAAACGDGKCDGGQVVGAVENAYGL